MRCDKILMSLFVGLLLFIDAISASRPINRIRNAPRRMSTIDFQKARARWNAGYFARLSDDEDLVLDGDVGSGSQMQNDDPGITNVNVPPTLTESSTEVTCCNLGKIAGSKGRQCDTKYYIGHQRRTKTRQLNTASRINQKPPRVTYPFTFKERLSFKYHKCSLKRFGDFYKCCNAQQYLFRRRFRLLRNSKTRYRHWRGQRIRG